MSEHGPTDDLPQVPFDGPADRSPLDGRALRAVIAGVAGVAVIGGGALGFVWLSSTPGNSSASAAVVPGAPSSPSAAATSDGSPSTVFSVNGRDVFAPLVTPDTGVAGSDGTATSSGATSNGSPAVVSSGPRTTAPAAVGSKPASVGTKSPASNAPVPGSAKPTPTVSRSTAPPWQKGSVTFKEIPVGSTTGTGFFVLDATGTNPVTTSLTSGSVIPSTSTVYRPWGTTTERGMTDAEKQKCEQQVKNAATTEEAGRISRSTKDCTVTDDFVWQAVFVPSSQAKLSVTNQENFGWMSSAGAQLADAVVGKVSGTVRWLGMRGEKYLVQVNDDAGVWIAKGDVVPGTSLTFEGVGLAPIAREDVAVFSSGGTKYFTVLGGGESSGVTF